MDTSFAPAGPTPMPPTQPDRPPMPSPTNGGAPPRLSRRQVKEMRRREQEEGVPFPLDWTGIEARVRLLTLSERATIEGFPLELQELLLEGFNKDQAKDVGPRSFDDFRRNVAISESTINALCVCGFVWPRLVATEDEWDGSDDCWVVTDLHIQERQAYARIVLGQDKEELARLRSFLRHRVAGVESHPADAPVPPAAAAV